MAIRYIAPISVAIITSPYIYKTLIRLGELKNAIESTDKINHRKSGFFYSIVRTIRFVYMYFFILLYKRLYGTKSLSKNISYVSFFHNMKWYYFPIISKRGPKRVIENVKIGCENNDIVDKTEFITRLAGPNVDFYGNNIRPIDLNCKLLMITVDGEQRTFIDDEVINF